MNADEIRWLKCVAWMELFGRRVEVPFTVEASLCCERGSETVYAQMQKEVDWARAQTVLHSEVDCGVRVLEPFWDLRENVEKVQPSAPEAPAMEITEKIYRMSAEGQYLHDKRVGSMLAVVEHVEHLSRDERTAVYTIANTINSQAHSFEAAEQWLDMLKWEVYRGGSHLALMKSLEDRDRRIMIVTQK